MPQYINPAIQNTSNVYQPAPSNVYPPAPPPNVYPPAPPSNAYQPAPATQTVIRTEYASVPDTYLALSIFTCLFCCWPFGLVAICKSQEVRGLLKACIQWLVPRGVTQSKVDEVRKFPISRFFPVQISILIHPKQQISVVSKRDKQQTKQINKQNKTKQNKKQQQQQKTKKKGPLLIFRFPTPLLQFNFHSFPVYFPFLPYLSHPFPPLFPLLSFFSFSPFLQKFPPNFPRVGDSPTSPTPTTPLLVPI